MWLCNSLKVIAGGRGRVIVRMQDFQKQKEITVPGTVLGIFMSFIFNSSNNPRT